MKRFFNIDYFAPLFLILYFIIAFINWDYSKGTRLNDGNIYPISSFSMFNRAPDIQSRAKLDKIRQNLKVKSE